MLRRVLGGWGQSSEVAEESGDSEISCVSEGSRKMLGIIRKVGYIFGVFRVFVASRLSEAPFEARELSLSVLGKCKIATAPGIVILLLNPISPHSLRVSLRRITASGPDRRFLHNLRFFSRSSSSWTILFLNSSSTCWDKRLCGVAPSRWLVLEAIDVEYETTMNTPREFVDSNWVTCTYGSLGIPQSLPSSNISNNFFRTLWFYI